MVLGRKGVSCPLSLLFLLAVLLVVASRAQAQEPKDAGGRALVGSLYRRPLGNEPSTLDPARINDVYSRSVAQQLFDGLVQFDQTLTIAPALAQFWKSSRDGLTWTFTLKKGVKFHHGREVTADDVVYSFTRILDPNTRSGAADLFVNIMGAQEFREGRATRVAGLTVLDRYTVRVTLSEALAPFASILAVGHAKIVPRELVEQQGEAFGTRPVGTGPFTFVRWDRGKEILLAANPDYFDGMPKITRLVYRIFPGENFDAMYSEFSRGQLEDSPIPTSDYRRILGLTNQIYVKRPMFSVRFYGLNRRLKPLDDRRIRQALIHAIDRTAVVDEVFLGRYVPARGVLPPGTQGYNPKLRGYAYDPPKARDLLAQAGYPGGRGLPPIAIWSSVRDRVVVEHAQLKRYLEAVGFQPEFHYETDWPTFSRMLGDGKLPVFLYAWYADVPDPDNFLTKLFHSRSPRNFSGYSNPAIDDLLARARDERDVLRRVELYRRAEQAIIDDAPIIPFWHYTYERIFQPYVRSVEVNGLGDPYIPLRKIWLDRPR
jgi:oligopeptide transport system substrate-binding protein